MDGIGFLDHAAVAVSAFTGALMGLQALGQLLSRPLNANRLTGAGMFFCLSVLILSLGLGHRRFPDFLLYLYGIHIPIYFLIAQLLLSYVRGVLGNSQAVKPGLEESGPVLRFPGYWRLAPACAALVICLPMFLMPPELKAAFNENELGDSWWSAYRQVTGATSIAGVLSVGYAAVRLFWELRIFEWIPKGDTPVVWHARTMLLWLALMVPLGVLVQILESFAMKRAVIALVSLGILWVYLLDHRYPRFFHRMDQEVRARNSKSRIQNLDIAATIERLNRMMREQRLYADEDLSRERLAAAMDLHRDQLTELMNRVMGVDFRQYVGRYRVEAARRMLVEEPGRTILSIAYASGFNSKSSFNHYFKSMVGQTPAEYRAANRVTAEPV